MLNISVVSVFETNTKRKLSKQSFLFQFKHKKLEGRSPSSEETKFPRKQTEFCFLSRNKRFLFVSLETTKGSENPEGCLDGDSVPLEKVWKLDTP